MKQSNKELLLKDLCARLPYRVICKVNYIEGVGSLEFEMPLRITVLDEFVYNKCEVKPYLRRVSDMTPSEQEEFSELTNFKDHPACELIDFYNSHHIDYRGMIDLELALRAKGIYKFE